MSICLTSAVIVIVFPLLSGVYMTFDKNESSVKLDFTLFGITVFKYNALINATGFTVKKSFKKKYFVAWTDLFKTPHVIGVPPLKRFSVLSIDFIGEIGIKETSALTLVSAIYVGKSAIFSTIKALKPNISITDELNVYYGSTALRTRLRVKIIFNLLDLFTISILNLWGKIKYAIGKQNKQRCGKRA